MNGDSASTGSGQNRPKDDSQIKTLDNYFSSLIDLIPAKIFFEGNEEILQQMENDKRDHFGDDSTLSAKAKHKRFKLDPKSGNKKVSEIANKFYNKSKNNPMDELKQKLNQRIQELKSKRGQKSNAKQLRESKKERKKLNSMRASKQKGFSKRKASDVQISSETEPKLKKVKSEDKSDDKRRSDQQTDAKLDKLPKIYNREGNLVFSKFDFVSTPAEEKKINKNKSKKNKLQRLLVKTKKEDKKLSELEATNKPKAKEVKEKKMWRNALDKSEGIKVKDNAKLIEKSIKMKKKMKQRSGQKWNDRKETTEKLMHQKQEKREKNQLQRKEQRKEKKFKRLKKKGRFIENK